LNLYAFVGGSPVTHVDMGGFMLKRKHTSTGKKNKKRKILIEESMEIRKPEDWEVAHNKIENPEIALTLTMNLGKEFDGKKNISGSKSGTIQRVSNNNFYFSPKSGYGAGQGTTYDKISIPFVHTLRPTYKKNEKGQLLGLNDEIVKKEKDAAISDMVIEREEHKITFARIASRVIKGTFHLKQQEKKTKIPNSSETSQKEGKAVLFGFLAMTSEWERGSISPIVALSVLGAAKVTDFYGSQDFNKNYIPKTSALFISNFDDELAALANEGTTDENYRNLYNNYEDFFSASYSYFQHKKDKKEDHYLNNIEYSEDEAVKKVEHFEAYKDHIGEKYHHLEW